MLSIWPVFSAEKGFANPVRIYPETLWICWGSCYLCSFDNPQGSLSVLPCLLGVFLLHRGTALVCWNQCKFAIRTGGNSPCRLSREGIASLGKDSVVGSMLEKGTFMGKSQTRCLQSDACSASKVHQLQDCSKVCQTHGILAGLQPQLFPWVEWESREHSLGPGADCLGAAVCPCSISGMGRDLLQPTSVWHPLCPTPLFLAVVRSQPSPRCCPALHSSWAGWRAAG